MRGFVRSGGNTKQFITCITMKNNAIVSDNVYKWKKYSRRKLKDLKTANLKVFEMCPKESKEVKGVPIMLFQI